MRKFPLFVPFTIAAFFLGCTEDKTSTDEYLDNYFIDIEEDEEPPLLFSIVVNGDTVKMLENDIQTLEGKYTDPTLSVSVHNWRQFPHGGISFEYPRNFSFEAEFDSYGKIWTLSGNSLTIMYIKMNGFLTIDMYTNELKSQFGQDNCKVEEITKTMNGETFDGRLLTVTLLTQNLNMEILEIDGDETKDFLVFQDAPNELESESGEYTKTMARVNETFKLSEF